MELVGGGRSSGVFLKDEGCFTSLYLLQNLKDEERDNLLDSNLILLAEPRSCVPSARLHR